MDKIIVGIADVEVEVIYFPPVTQSFTRLDRDTGVSRSLRLPNARKATITIRGGSLSNTLGSVTSSAFLICMAEGLGPLRLAEPIKQGKKTSRISEIRSARLIEFADGSQMLFYQKPIPVPNIEGETVTGHMRKSAQGLPPRLPRAGKEKIVATEFRPDCNPNLTHWHFDPAFHRGDIECLETEQRLTLKVGYDGACRFVLGDNLSRGPFMFGKDPRISSYGFPTPSDIRRWNVVTDGYISVPLEPIVDRPIRWSLDPFSSFRFLAGLDAQMWRQAARSIRGKLVLSVPELVQAIELPGEREGEFHTTTVREPRTISNRGWYTGPFDGFGHFGRYHFFRRDVNGKSYFLVFSFRSERRIRVFGNLSDTSRFIQSRLCTAPGLPTPLFVTDHKTGHWEGELDQWIRSVSTRPSH